MTECWYCKDAFGTSTKKKSLNYWQGQLPAQDTASQPGQTCRPGSDAVNGGGIILLSNGNYTIWLNQWHSLVSWLAFAIEFDYTFMSPCVSVVALDASTWPSSGHPPPLQRSAAATTTTAAVEDGGGLYYCYLLVCYKLKYDCTMYVRINRPPPPVLLCVYTNNNRTPLRTLDGNKFN